MSENKVLKTKDVVYEERCAELKKGKNAIIYDLQKPTKKKAASILEDLDFAVRYGRNYDAGKCLALLQRFFTVKVPAKTIAKDDLRWCLQAVSIDIKRQPLLVAKVFGEYVVATDGRRLHKVKHGREGITDGAFTKDMKHISEEEFLKLGSYPNYKRVVPDKGPEDEFVPVVSIHNLNDKTISLRPEDAKFKTVVDEEFWNQLTAGMVNPKFFQIEPEDKWSTAITVEDEETGRMAVIMPIRIK